MCYGGCDCAKCNRPNEPIRAKKRKCKKPDGFEVMVDNAQECWGLTVAQRERVDTLLRQQHRKIRQMVSRYHAASVRLAKISKHRDISLLALTRLKQCEDILTKLDHMAKGGKG